MLDKKQATDQVQDLLGVHRSERSELDDIRRYWKGRQGLPAIIPSSAPREVREMARISRVNVCAIVVDSIAQSLFVDGFRLGGGPDSRAVSAEMAPQWSTWQANRFDKWQAGTHRAASAYGTAYEVVLPGDTFPTIRTVSPRRMLAMYGEDLDWPMWALESVGGGLFVLYDDTHRYWVEISRDPNTREEKTTFVSSEEHDAEVVPVVRFLDQVDVDADDEVNDLLTNETSDVTLGQVAPLKSLQDQIDLTTFNLLVAQHYSAFRQRYILGWVADSEEQQMKASASQLWTFEDHPDEVKVGEFEQTDLKGYIESREHVLKYAATLSQTPVHELTGQLVNMAAEALAAAEAGKDRKVDERKTSHGESHEQTFQLIGRYTGQPVPDDSQVVWRDTSARSFAATVDALGKLAQMLGVPPQELWERIPGATQQDIARWKAASEQGDAITFMTDLLDRQAQDA
jgi:hypothetical protein